MYYEPQKNIQKLVNMEDMRDWGNGRIAKVEYPYPKSYPKPKMTAVSIRAFLNQIIP